MSGLIDSTNAVTDPAKFDPELASHRAELAACYRCLYRLGINTFPYNHCTVDCGEGRFLVNRYGLSWAEVTAENLLLVDVEVRRAGIGTPTAGARVGGHLLTEAARAHRTPRTLCRAIFLRAARQ